MTNEQINIALAEACGWRMINSVFPDKSWIKPDKTCVGIGTESIPDYLNDLNAMHDAEKMLNSEQWVAYGKELSRLGVFPMVHATAVQRAEAFLRTLGKWDEVK